MERSLVSVRLDEVDWENRSFAVRSFASDEALKHSVERCGLLCPPWVRATDAGKYIIVDGFKRFHLLRKVGAERVDCVVFPEGTDHVSLLLHRIEGKLTGPPLNPAEKAQIISKLTDALPSQQVMSLFFPALNVPPRLETLEKWCRLAASGDAIMEALAAESLCERAALEVAGWEEEAQREVVSLLGILRCSASIQMEILERITEIASGWNKERITLLSSPELQEVLGHGKWNHRQKTQTIRDMLYRWRFPRLRTREERFERELAEAHLPQAVRLIPPRFFEGEQWQLQLTFHHPEELQQIIEKVEEFARSKKLREIIRPGRSEENLPSDE